MLHKCNPKSQDALNECAMLGKSLNRFSETTILTILAKNHKPLHGYIIVQLAEDSPMFAGSKPNAAGIYRTLKKMEDGGLLSSQWSTPKDGSAKRLYTITDQGLLALRRWVDALACYSYTLELLRKDACAALEIEIPELPECYEDPCE